MRLKDYQTPNPMEPYLADYIAFHINELLIKTSYLILIDEKLITPRENWMSRESLVKSINASQLAIKQQLQQMKCG